MFGLDTLMEFLLAGLNWFLEWIKPMINDLLMPLAEALPDLTWATTGIGTFLGCANRWVALDVGLGLLTIFFIFIIIMIAVKLIVKLLIPTVG